MSEEREMMAGPRSNEQGDAASSTKYKGVRKRKWGKWVSEVRLPNSRERIWLGSYDSAEKAAKAFDAAQFCLRGRNAHARLNFPDDPPNIAGGRDLAPSEIQVAAARFANSAPEPPPSSGHMSACLVPQTESPSASEGTVVGMDHDFGMYTDVSICDPSRYGGGSCYYGLDYGIFPGFDDLNNDYFGTHTMNGSNYGDENYDGVLVQDYRLWNF